MDRDVEDEVETEEEDIWVEHQLNTKTTNSNLNQDTREGMCTRIQACTNLSNTKDRLRVNAIDVMVCWTTCLGPILGGTM